ncbi:hypothetical protein R1sor_024040 [Riccia sorocarpa]|uniref:Large ribosomal subunit protein uL4m n=1 Tax=Riccia sorocarpa TaxID=122646 RepID=A0ABD3GTE2_9MARC
MAVFWRNSSARYLKLSSLVGWFSGSVASHGPGLRGFATVTQGSFTDKQVAVTNFARDDKGTTTLAGDIFDVPIRRDIVHRVVVWQLAKRRQGTHSTKTISEVSGTGKKPGPQKGSGRARHGTLRGPQFRGGATMHGPKPRDYEIDLQKKVRRMGLKVVLSARVAEGKLRVFENIVPPSARTKDMANFLFEMDAKKVLFVDDCEKMDASLVRATSNLHYANALPVKGLNVYSILQHDTLVMTLGAIRSLEQRLHTPISR